MTSLCTPSRPAPTTIARSALFALLGGAVLLACSDPLPPAPDAAVAISKQAAQSVESADLGNCPDEHGRKMFPLQGTLVLQSTTPASTVLDTMATIDSGVKCSVKGADGSYAISVEIKESGVEGVGDFRLNGVNVVDGVSTSGGSLYWLLQGFGFSGNCAVTVDERPPTAENPDPFFVEPGIAKLSFLCDPFLNSDNQACRAEGTVFMRNCTK